MSKLIDLLAFAAHPDDAELSCSGTLLRHISQGKKIGIIDLTRGELGTRGNAEIREREAVLSSKILGIEVRENLEMKDGFFMNDPVHQLKVITAIRKYRPSIVLANAVSDRHPDHGKAASLVADAFFLSGLIKIETFLDGKPQEPWRPKALYHYIQDQYVQPDFLVDISDFMEKKMESIKAFSSQFYNPESNEPDTYISSSQFLDSIRARAIEFGKILGVKYAEGFTSARVPGVDDLFSLR